MWKIFKDILRAPLSRNTVGSSGCTLEESQKKFKHAQNSQIYWKKKHHSYLLFSENLAVENILNRENSWKKNVNQGAQTLLGGIGWGAIFALGYQYGLPLIKSHITEINRRLKNGCRPECSATPQLLSWLAFSLPSKAKFGNSIKSSILPESALNVQKSASHDKKTNVHKENLNKLRNDIFNDDCASHSEIHSFHHNETLKFEALRKSSSLPILSPEFQTNKANPIIETFNRYLEDRNSLLQNKIGVGLAGQNDLKQAFAAFQLASFGSNVDALYNLGICYERGLGTKQDVKKAMECYNKAASKEKRDAVFNLGVLECASEDLFDSGIERLTEAAQCGDKAAQSYVGAYFLKCGEYHGASWMLKAASKQGDVVAMFNLAQCYENGWGVPLNFAEAFKLFKKASDAGSLDASYSLAKIFHRGQEAVPRDNNLARELCEKLLKNEKDLDADTLKNVKHMLIQIRADSVPSSVDAKNEDSKNKLVHLHESFSSPNLVQKNNSISKLHDLLKSNHSLLVSSNLDGQPKSSVDDDDNVDGNEQTNHSIILT